MLEPTGDILRGLLYRRQDTAIARILVQGYVDFWSGKERLHSAATGASDSSAPKYWVARSCVLYIPVNVRNLSSEGGVRPQT